MELLVEPEGWGLAGKTVEIAEMLLVALTESTEFAAKFATEKFAVLTEMVQLTEPEPVVAVRRVLLTQIELAEWLELLA